MKTHKRKTSIFTKILLPMVIVAVLQSAFFMGIIFEGGISARLSENAYDIFNQQVVNRRNEYQNQMMKWSDLSDFISAIENEVNSVKSAPEKDSDKQLLSNIVPILISIIRQNNVNGSFFILAGDDSSIPTSDSMQTKHGVSLRDLDTSSGFNENNADILFERGPASIASEKGLALDSWWESTYSYEDEKESDYYYKPLLAALENESNTSTDYMYWSKPRRGSEEASEFISCSLPIFSADGTPIGILGVELLDRHIKDLLPSNEMGKRGMESYVLAEKNGENSFSPLISSGFMFAKNFSRGEAITIDPNKLATNCYEINVNNSKNKNIACVTEISTYNTTSPFYSKSLVLIGIVAEKELLGFSRGVIFSVLFAGLISLFLGIGGAFISGKIFSFPVKNLVRQVRNGNGAGNKSLGRVNILEIDELIQAIEKLNADVNDSQNRISEIIRMSGVMVGTFELDRSEDRVFVSNDFFSVMGDVFRDKSNMNETSKFAVNMKELDRYIICRDGSENSCVYFFPQTKKWIKLKALDDGTRCLGIVLDVTGEMTSREKIEYERDHDVLTGLLNRRAMDNSLNQIFEKPLDLQISAMIMMDVDNLKRVNDTYGHDYGDYYLQAVSTILRTYENEKSFVCRMSGDEFAMFLFGYSDKEEIMRVINSLEIDLLGSSIWLPDGSRYKVRVTRGIAWLPDDANEPRLLKKYADFTMMSTKKTKKGTFAFFNKEKYDQAQGITVE